MGFLDNSGDIILDAVLTDTGRKRLAKGDGSFRITKFALADDEIDYNKYDKNHASGSAYYDLDILKTPVFEAFTNNIASMKSKLMTIPRTNLLYLPVMKLNRIFSNDYAFYDDGTVTNTFVVAVDETTEDKTWTGGTVGNTTGVLKGEDPQSSGAAIRVDQGLDTSDIPPKFQLDADLLETQYIIEMDNRLGTLVDSTGNPALVSYIDDDNIASYYLSSTTNSAFVTSNVITDNDEATQTIAGPRGTILIFKIRSSIELNTSTTLFERLGSTTTMKGLAVRYIDTTIRVTGATTGYRLDIPVRFIKDNS